MAEEVVLPANAAVAAAAIVLEELGVKVNEAGCTVTRTCTIVIACQELSGDFLKSALDSQKDRTTSCQVTMKHVQ